MAQQLGELVDNFCNYQRKQRGKTEGGVKAYRWTLTQFLLFIRDRGKVPRITDLTSETVQARGCETAEDQNQHYAAHHRPVGADDALIAAARQRKRPRDVAVFLILRYTGMRRQSVADLALRHLDASWGLRGVPVKGGMTRDLPLPSVVMTFLQAYVQLVLAKVGKPGPDTPLFWSTWGRRGTGKTRAPMTGKNNWRLCKTYGRIIGYPELTPHDLGHGVAMEVLEQQHDLEQVRALLGHARIDTTQVYASIRPPQLKKRRSVLRGAGGAGAGSLRTAPGLRNIHLFLKTRDRKL